MKVSKFTKEQIKQNIKRNAIVYSIVLLIAVVLIISQSLQTANDVVENETVIVYNSTDINTSPLLDDANSNNLETSIDNSSKTLVSSGNVTPATNISN